MIESLGTTSKCSQPKIRENLMGNQTWSMMRKTKKKEKKKDQCNLKE
jgi:hypothetical protein